MPVERYCILATCGGNACLHRNAAGSCVYEYDASKCKDAMRWKGEGDPPRRWRSADGTIVYRTLADYYDD